MAALTAARLTESKNLRFQKRYLMKASTTIYYGSLVMINTNGTAEPATASASNHGVVGVATETKTSGASGSTYIMTQTGIFRFAATSIAQANVGSLMYAQDDQTVDETQAANQPIAGILLDYVSATEGWVAVGPEFLT